MLKFHLKTGLLCEHADMLHLVHMLHLQAPRLLWVLLLQAPSCNF